MRKFLTLSLLLMLSVSAFARQHSVKGTVTDQNGLPVIGMAVLEQGTTNGVVTDVDGVYSITVSSPQATLEFNALGYESVVEQVGGVQVQQTSGLPGGHDGQDSRCIFNRFQQ